MPFALDPRLLDGLALAGSLAACTCALLARRRLRAGADGAQVDAAAAGGEAGARARRGALVGTLAQALRPTSHLELEQLVTRLACAGRRGRDAIDLYLEEKVRFLLGSLVL